MVLPMCVAWSGCAALQSAMSPQSKDDGLARVDALVAGIEKLQIEAAVGKERSHEALEQLQVLASPEFNGDAVTMHASLMTAVERSEAQAKQFAGAVPPIKVLADEIFERWTADLERFGGSKLRQRSQTRLEETRASYEAVLKSTVSAQIAFESLNADLRDHALYLEHDFNAAAIELIADDVVALSERSNELDLRLDRCSLAARDYVAKTALHGQLAEPAAPVAAREPSKASSQTRTLRRRAPVAESAEEAAPPAPTATASVPKSN